MSLPGERRGYSLAGLSIQSKFIGVTIGMTLGIVAILAVYFISVERNLLRTELRNRASALARNLVYNCGYPLLLEDFPALKQIAAGILHEEDAAFVLVRGVSGTTVFETAPALPPTAARAEVIGNLQPAGVTEPGLYEKKDFLLVSLPILRPSEEDFFSHGRAVQLHEANVIGEAVLGFSLTRTNGLIVRSVKSALLMTVAIAAVGILLSLPVARYFMNPLSKLLRGTKELASGDTSYRVEVHRGDELGCLAESFNAMAERLEENKKALHDYNFELENKVVERTRELIERERELISVLENNPAGIILVDARTDTVTWANSNAARILKCHGNNICGCSFSNYIDYDKQFYDRIKGSPDHAAIMESTLTTMNREKIQVLNSVIYIVYNKRPHFLHAFFDITERKRIDIQMQYAERMYAIGTLAGGIAHDFNNILSIVIVHTELALMDNPPESPSHESLNQVLKACHRAKELVHQILTFSRPNSKGRKPLLVGILVKEILKMLRAALPSNIDIRQSIEELPEGGDIVNADPTQIQQVLMNLCTNAGQAMPKGGILTVSLAGIDFTDGDASRPTNLNPGSYLRLSVSDTGHGIEEAILDRIFEPYFTTKRVGEGTGLGLAVVHGIIAGHGGAVAVSSNPGEGSTFDVFLPRFAGTLDDETSEAEEPPTGTETILLVDDEPALVSAAGTRLQCLGYTVISGTSSVEALETFRRQPERFHLVIADMTMPVMTGVDLAQEILRIRPEIPVILCSGFNAAITPKKAAAMGVRKLLMKPLTMKMLAKAARQVLDGESA